MSDPIALRRYAATLALLGWLAMITQLYLNLTAQLEQGNSLAFGLLMYSGYYTILTNLFCAAVATACALTQTSARVGVLLRNVSVISAAAVSIFMVGVVYMVLLRNQHDPQGLQFLVNALTHYILPVGFVVFWFRVVPARSLEWADLPRLMVFPIVYLVYLALRGEVTGLYPYFFFDVARLGYAQASINAVGMAAGFVLVSSVFIAIKKR
jgi:hypothetical protein